MMARNFGLECRLQNVSLSVSKHARIASGEMEQIPRGLTLQRDSKVARFYAVACVEIEALFGSVLNRTNVLGFSLRERSVKIVRVKDGEPHERTLPAHSWRKSLRFLAPLLTDWRANHVKPTGVVVKDLVFWVIVDADLRKKHA